MKNSWIGAIAGKMRRFLRSVWDCDEANEVVEFAVVLPIVAVLLVGILDFGSAFNLKQELNNAAREGTRWAINEGTIDLSQTTPTSILSVRDVVVNYLTNAHVNVCGLGSVTPSSSGFQSWTFTASTGCPGNFTLIVDRGLTTVSGGTTLTLTHVTLKYPYQWRFSKVATLVAPSANYQGLTQLTTDAYMQNLP